MDPLQPPTNLPEQISANGERANAAPPGLLPPLRGLTLLLIAYAGSLAASLVGGALRTYYLTQLFTNRSSVSALGDMMSLVFGGFFAFHLIAAAAVLFGIASLAESPPEARVTKLTRGALAFLAVSLGLAVVSYGLSRYGGQLLPRDTLDQVLRGIGYLDTGLDLVGTVLLIECLLRLRRYGAPDDREVANSESFLRGALIGLYIVRILVDYTSHLLRSALNSALETSLWPAYLVRALLSLLFIGTLLYLIQATGKALRAKRLAPLASSAAAEDSATAASAELTNRAYRNLIFGALWAIGGIAVTAISYQQAASGGGRYLFAYGAIIFGVIQCIRGFVQIMGRS